MYWGASDEVRSGAPDPKLRVRRLVVGAAVSVLSIGGTVAMASASPSHATQPNAVVVAADRAEVWADSARSPLQHIGSVTTTTAPPVTTTTVAPRPTPPAPEHQAVSAALQSRSTTPAHASLAATTGCGAALAYLSAHSAPGFHFECPGYALGHQAMTCVNVAGVCPGAKLIVISVVCPASYMNEAHNSWIMAGLASGSIDPYGYCH